MSGVARVEAGAVIDDPLEDRYREDAHTTMFTDADR